MDAHYPTVDEPATPEYVLTVLRDDHRQQCQTDWAADPDAVLTLETTVAEWREACDLVGWRELGRATNQEWSITCSDAEWRAVLEPAPSRRLGDVCRLIASRTRRATVRPARMFGGNCTPAGVFLTIRSLLHCAGAPAGTISPSTSLSPYARRYLDVFLGPVSRLSPGSLPLLKFRPAPFYRAAERGLIAGGLCLLVGLCAGSPLLTITGGVLFTTSCALDWYAPPRLLPASVEFGDLQTFRDLAIVIARGRPV